MKTSGPGNSGGSNGAPSSVTMTIIAALAAVMLGRDAVMVRTLCPAPAENTQQIAVPYEGRLASGKRGIEGSIRF